MTDARPQISVVLPTHDPHPTRFLRTLEGLRGQLLPNDTWELLIIDNASVPPVSLDSAGVVRPLNVRVIREERLGLTAARKRGIEGARSDIIVFVDDDNVLVPDYLALVREAFAANPELGAVGGRSVPEFETPPEDWVRSFDGLLALRDLGPATLRASWPKDQGGRREYPRCAPIGAGMAVRRVAALAYSNILQGDPRRLEFDRTGSSLVSGGDNDLVMTVLEQGFSVAYLPRLQLTHLIPPNRCTRAYLGALNRGIARSWVQVLSLHNACPWRPVPRGTVGLRKARAWFRHGAWKGAEPWVRWQGACGHFEGLGDVAASAAPIRR